MEKGNEKEMNKECLSNPLRAAYLIVHEKEPQGMNDWEIAKAVLEVLDDPNWINNDLAKECIYQIINQIGYPDEKIRKEIIAEVEYRARNIFPELSNVTEPHMDQIEYYYRKWKEKRWKEKRS